MLLHSTDATAHAPYYTYAPFTDEEMAWFKMIEMQHEEKIMMMQQFKSVHVSSSDDMQ